MPTKKPPTKQPPAAGSAADLTPADVRAWLADLAAGDHVSSDDLRPPAPAKRQDREALRPGRRRPQRGKIYVPKSA